MRVVLEKFKCKAWKNMMHSVVVVNDGVAPFYKRRWCLRTSLIGLCLIAIILFNIGVYCKEYVEYERIDF